MTQLSFPIPVAVLLRRIFNVVSTLAASNEYFLLRHTEVTGDSDIQKGPPWSNEQLKDSKSNQLEAHVSTLSSSSPPDPPPPSGEPNENHENSSSILEKLMQNPLLFDPTRKPRNPIVLCHGLYGFDVRGPSAFPSLQMHYWSNVLKILKSKVGADVIVTGVPGTGSIESRAERMHEFLQSRAEGHGINFVAHSMGGLDCRHLISHYKDKKYVPLSLTTVCTPHRGSPFMDWCTANIGLGKRFGKYPSSVSDPATKPPELDSPSGKVQPPPTSSGATFTLSSLPSSFTTLLLSIIDSPAYANLTSVYCNDIFNPNTPDDPNVRYFSVAARTKSVSVWHPLWLPKMVLDGSEERERNALKVKYGRDVDDGEWGNDGLVSVRSAKWGEFLGTLENCDHWEARGAGGLVNIDSLSVSNDGQGWSWRDWGRFVGMWKKEEEDRVRVEEGRRRKETPPGVKDSVQERQKEIMRAKQRAKEGDDVLKASTERLSAVFNWIVEQVPTPLSSLKGGDNAQSAPSESDFSLANPKPNAEDIKKPPSEPPAQFDVERFYVALSRKLYEEGL